MGYIADLEEGISNILDELHHTHQNILRHACDKEIYDKLNQKGTESITQIEKILYELTTYSVNLLEG